MLKKFEIDDILVSGARQLGNHDSDLDAINTAIKDYIAKKKKMGLINLIGTIEIYPDYKYKQKRRNRFPENDD